MTVNRKRTALLMLYERSFYISLMYLCQHKISGYMIGIDLKSMSGAIF